MDEVETFLARVPAEDDAADLVCEARAAENLPERPHQVTGWLRSNIVSEARRGRAEARELEGNTRMLSRIRMMAEREWEAGRPESRRAWSTTTFRRYAKTYAIDPVTMTIVWYAIKLVLLLLWKLFNSRNGCAPGAAIVEA